MHCIYIRMRFHLSSYTHACGYKINFKSRKRDGEKEGVKQKERNLSLARSTEYIIGTIQHMYTESACITVV